MKTTTKTLVVVDNDEGFQDLIAAEFPLDSRFTVAGVSGKAEDAFEMAQANKAALVVLDYHLDGRLTGLEAAQKFKDVAPQLKVILFTDQPELREAVEAEPAVDAFVLKSDSRQLLRVAQQVLGL